MEEKILFIVVDKKGMDIDIYVVDENVSSYYMDVDVDYGVHGNIFYGIPCSNVCIYCLVNVLGDCIYD